jgi:hypothetical protein
MTGGVFSGLSVSPLGQSFVGDFRLTFDMWMNYQGGAANIGTGGTAAAGGNGTTQALGYGIGTAGTTAQWAGGVHDSLHFAATVDGGSAQDYRVYPGTNIASPLQFPNYYAAGNTTTPTDARNDTHTYYAGLGLKTAPAAQVTLFPEQSGTTRTGALGFAWHQVEILRIGNIVTWRIDNKLFATVDTAYLPTLGGNNILFNFYDTNTSSSTDANAPSLLFGLIDNVVVTPEPTAAALLVLGGAVVCLRRRK